VAAVVILLAGIFTVKRGGRTLLARLADDEDQSVGAHHV